MDSKIFSPDFRVTVWELIKLPWEDRQYAAEIISEKGYKYLTGILSEHDFHCLVGQTLQDRIKEIIIVRGNEEKFLSSELISDAVKSKLWELI